MPDHYGDDLSELEYSGFDEPEFVNEPRRSDMAINWCDPTRDQETAREVGWHDRDDEVAELENQTDIFRACIKTLEDDVADADERTESAAMHCKAVGEQAANTSSAMIDDLHALLDVLDLGNHARPKSPHDVFAEEILPAVEALRTKLAEAEERAGEWQGLVSDITNAVDVPSGHLYEFVVSLRSQLAEAEKRAEKAEKTLLGEMNHTMEAMEKVIDQRNAAIGDAGEEREQARAAEVERDALREALKAIAAGSDHGQTYHTFHQAHLTVLRIESAARAAITAADAPGAQGIDPDDHHDGYEIPDGCEDYDGEA